MKKHIYIFIILFFTLQLYADNNNDTIQKANKLYTEEKYNDAIELYIQIIKNGCESSELYYNLGNAYFKINDIPSAILYYEKALKLNPEDEDIDFNLKVANSRITDKIDAVPELFYKRWWIGFCNLFAADNWGRITAILFFIFLVLITIYLLSRIIMLKKVAFWLGTIIFLFSIITFLLGYKQYNTIKSQTEAIVFAPSTAIKSSPYENSKDLFVIHEGTKVKILDEVNHWYKIKIANGSVGWINGSKIKII